MKKNCFFVLASLLFVSFLTTSCGDDNIVEDIIDVVSGDNHKNPFVGNKYAYEWAGEEHVYVHIIEFTSDSTFSFSTVEKDTGDNRHEPYKADYEYDSDSRSISFLRMNYKSIHVGSRYYTLHEGEFPKDNYDQLRVYRTLTFGSGNSKTTWLTFDLLK